MRTPLWVVAVGDVAFLVAGSRCSGRPSRVRTDPTAKYAVPHFAA